MLVTGRAPFQEANDSETLTMILDCKYYLPSHLSPECADLISKMLVREPEERIKLEDISNHDWLRSSSNEHSNNSEEENDFKIVHRKRSIDNLKLNNSFDSIPLIKKEHLTEKENNEIFEFMVNGKIAMREEITKALDDDSYNYITATYYLLAEQLLRTKYKKKRKFQKVNSNDLFSSKSTFTEQSEDKISANIASSNLHSNKRKINNNTNLKSFQRNSLDRQDEETELENDQSNQVISKSIKTSENSTNVLANSNKKDELTCTKINDESSDVINKQITTPHLTNILEDEEELANFIEGEAKINPDQLNTTALLFSSNLANASRRSSKSGDINAVTSLTIPEEENECENTTNYRKNSSENSINSTYLSRNEEGKIIIAYMNVYSYLGSDFEIFLIS
jgi:serine/threonine protein kinase